MKAKEHMTGVSREGRVAGIFSETGIIDFIAYRDHQEGVYPRGARSASQVLCRS